MGQKFTFNFSNKLSLTIESDNQKLSNELTKKTEMRFETLSLDEIMMLPCRGSKAFTFLFLLVVANQNQQYATEFLRILENVSQQTIDYCLENATTLEPSFLAHLLHKNLYCATVIGKILEKASTKTIEKLLSLTLSDTIPMRYSLKLAEPQLLRSLQEKVTDPEMKQKLLGFIEPQDQDSSSRVIFSELKVHPQAQQRSYAAGPGV